MIFDLQVDGWRAINHSYALVNQFHLLEWARQPDVHLVHNDIPYLFPHWGKDTNPAGFDAEDEAVLERLTSPEKPAACVFRIHAPRNLEPIPRSRVGVFLVSESGINPDDANLAPERIRGLEAAGGFIVTPSHWSRQRLLHHGFSEAAVHVVPHAASGKYFHPLSAELRRAQRRVLKFRDDEVLLLNVGTASWNKGLDLLLYAFGIVRRTRKDLRLLIKDQRYTYGIDGAEYIQSKLKEAGLLVRNVLDAITIIPHNMDLRGLNALYNLADVYVSPYRAEGYNLPVREALACGTPVMVTSGGATDDFIAADAPGRIDACLYEGVEFSGKLLDAYLEPDLDHLVTLLSAAQAKTPSVMQSVQSYAACLPTWADACDRIRGIFNG